MRTTCNGKCNNSQLAQAQAVFCFPSEPNIPEVSTALSIKNVAEPVVWLTQ